MKTAFAVLIVSLCVLSFAIPGESAIIAQCTTETSTALVVSTTWTQAHSFDVSAPTTATEIQLRLSRWSGSTGTFTVTLRADSNGYPSATALITLNKAVSTIPKHTPTWTSFKWSGTALSAGTYWIVCRVSTDSDAEIDCWSTDTNVCGTGRDSMTSFDYGATWPVLQKSDMNYIVYGSRTPLSTTTTVTADPASICTQGVSTITVTVRDSLSNLVLGPGLVSLRASSGNLGTTNLTLKDGTATTTYTAGSSAGTPTVTATFSGHSFAGNDYQGSNGSTSITVNNQNRTTTTAQTLGSGSVNTRGTVSISVTVKDSLLNPVPGGKVTFECTGGTISPNPANVSSGQASATFTAGIDAGNYTVKASYSGFVQGGVNYAASTDSDPITINLTPVNTSTTLNISPNPCYINKNTFVSVIVKDSGGKRVPGGSVQLSAPSGSFDAPIVALAGGFGWTKWTAPGTTGNVNITATYQQYDADGYRYQTSSSTKSEGVNKDPDTSRPGLSYLLEWNSDYKEKPLAGCGPEAQAFAQKLTDIGWSGEEWSNKDAWERDMKGDWWFHSGNENDYVDYNDITWYSGHGNPDFITFITDEADNYLEHDDVYDLLGNGNWGDRDAEWMCLSACQVMSHASNWATTMDGQHCICGFITNGYDQENLGKAFASLLIKDSVYDSPYTMSQAWFFAGDMSQPQKVKLRVIGQTEACLSDYLWGYGTVAADPADDSTYYHVEHDVLNYNPPTAEANGPYTGKTGEWICFSAAGSSEPDPESRLYYGWDTDTSVNTDDKDWDLDNVDEADDDIDDWGYHGFWRYPTAGVYNIRLICIDSRWKVDDDYATVTVTAAKSSASPPETKEAALEDGGIEIVDDYPGLPQETSLPVFRTLSSVGGFNEMSNIAQRFGINDPAQIDDLGNWSMTTGDNHMIVNEHTGSVLYANLSKAYRYTGPPPGLPDEVQAFAMADTFLNASGINYAGAVHDSVTDISFGSDAESSNSTPSRLPFQRRANYSRTLEVEGTQYPVVGPGGKIYVVFDQPMNPEEPTQYMKIWRSVYQAESIPLYPAAQAIADFHTLGIKALIYDSKIPLCNRIEIKNVYLGYYEADFVTPQNVLYPVYVLDMRCFNEDSSFWVKGYLSALAAPVEATISSPEDEESETPYGSLVHLSGAGAGGQPPYTLEWSSNIDGFLGTGSDLDVELSGSAKAGEVRAHTITLRATDQKGFSAQDTATVRVIPNEPSDAIKAHDGAPVWLHGQVVIGSLWDRFYIEESDRSAGVAVEPTVTAVGGDIVSVKGVMQTIEGERIVTAPECSILSSANPLPKPLFAKSLSLGGSFEIPFPAGVTGAPDLYNLGILVRTAGWIRQVGPDYIYVDDGSGLKDGTMTADEENIGIRVVCYSPEYVVGQYVIVTGICSSFEAVPGQYARRILTRGPQDILSVWQ